MAERDYDGLVVVITGASSGFGRGAALRFAERGASLVLGARRAAALEDVVAECELRGAEAFGVLTDVSIPGAVHNLCARAVDQYGRIDVWVNNAGVAALGRFEEVPLDDHLQVIATDLLGTIAGSWYAMREFRRQGSGVLINIASALGKIPAPYYGSYTAAKYGVVGLSAVLRQEIQEHSLDGIHVCTVMPTSMDTPFFEHAGNYTGHEAVPIPPLYDAEKVVETIVDLARDPRDEIAVGTAGKAFVVGHNIAPDLIEGMMAKQTRRSVEKAAPATNTPGNVHQPVERGTGVHGSLRA